MEANSLYLKEKDRADFALDDLTLDDPGPEPEAGAADPPLSFAREMAMEWVLTVNPPLVVTNILPCPVEIEIVQPRHEDALAAEDQQRRDAAIDIFYLPEAVQRAQSVTSTKDIDWARKYKATAALGQSDPEVFIRWRGIVQSGKQEAIGHIAEGSSLYIRMRFPNDREAQGVAWSDVTVITPAEYADRQSFIDKPPQPITWGCSREHGSGVAGGNEICVAGSWGRASCRRLTVYAAYWLVNSTGLGLWYKHSGSSTGHYAAGEADSSAATRVPSATPLLEDRACFSDLSSFSFHGHSSLPVMLDGAAKALRVMPYCLSTEVLQDDLVVCELEVNCSSHREYRCQQQPAPGQLVYGDGGLQILSLPPQVQGGGRLIQILTPSKPGGSTLNSDEDSFIKFWANKDAYVYVLVPAAVNSGKGLEWLEQKGFRCMPGWDMHCGEPGPGPGPVKEVQKPQVQRSITFATWRKYCTAKSWVTLGKPLQPHGDQYPYHYSVLVGTCLERNHVDVADVEVDRDLAEAIMCNSRYKLLPDFQPGDRCYVDRDYTIPSLPAALLQQPLMCLQTAQDDKRATGRHFLRFTVLQPSKVLVCIDSRAAAAPKWLAADGFVRAPQLSLAGAEYRTPYTYDVYSKAVPRGPVSLGGNQAPGSKRNYFVLIHADTGSTKRNVTVPPSACQAATTEQPRAEEGVGEWRFWDTEQSGPITYTRPQFDAIGRHWSSRFSVDAVSTSGQLETPCATFGVSIRALPGLFQRTKVVTLFPRFIVRSALSVSLQVIPVLLQGSLPIDAELEQLRSSAPSGALIEPQSSVVVYGFDSPSSRPGHSHASRASGTVDGSPNRCIVLCCPQVPSASPAQPPPLLSQPVMLDEVGQTYLWLHGQGGTRYLIRASVTIQGCTVFTTLSDAAQYPPYRIENRSSAASLVYRQNCSSASRSWVRLDPLQWHSYLWEKPKERHELRVAIHDPAHEILGAHSSAYSLDKIGDLEQLAAAPHSLMAMAGLAPTPHQLFVQVRAEGCTRVISFTDTQVVGSGGYRDPLPRLRRLYRCLEVDCSLPGYNYNLVRSSRTGSIEVLSGFAEGIALNKKPFNSRIEFVVGSIQVDDMRPLARVPTLLQQSRQAESQPRTPNCAFLRLLLEPDMSTLAVTHLKAIAVHLQPLEVKLDVDYILYLAAFFTKALPEFADSAVLDKVCRRAAKRAVRGQLYPPRGRQGSMIYLELCHVSELIVHLELLASQRALHLDVLASEDPDELSLGGLAYLGGGFLSAVSVVGSSLAHVSPSFTFDELLVQHYFGSAEEFLKLLLMVLKQQAVAQGYKIVGSMELLGDPLSLVSKWGDGVAQFVIKTQRELLGKSDTPGEGARSLVEGIVGGTFGSASKITGSLADVIRGLSGTKLSGGAASRQEGASVKDLGHGLEQGGKVLVHSVRQGISGLVDRPMEGAKEEGMAGFITGVAKGIVGAVASPVAGAFGAVSKVTQGVDAATRVRGVPTTTRRRLPRTKRGVLLLGQPLLRRASLDVIPE
ncbi:unnamed protein product [Chrysoparadoxa australica]